MGFVQFKGAEGSGTSMSVTMASAPTNGNVLVAFATSAIGGETIGTGWTNIIIQGEATLDGCWAIKTAGASESTTQTPYTQSSGLYTVGVWEFSGVSATNDGFAVTENASATPPTVTITATPGSGGDYAVVGAAFNGNSTGSPTITQGGTSITIDGQNLTGNSAVWGHLNSAPSGSQSYVATFGTGTNRCTGGVLFLKPAGGTPHTQALTGVTSFSGAVPKATSHKISTPVLSFAGAAPRIIGAVVQGAVSFSGSVRRAVGKTLSGVLSYAGSIPSRVIGAALPGALPFSGTAAKVTNHGLPSATGSFSGSLAKGPRKNVGAVSLTTVVPPTIVQSASNASTVSTAANTVSATISTPTAGNLLLCIASAGYAPNQSSPFVTWTLPGGATTVFNNVNGLYGITAFYMTAVGTETSVSVTATTPSATTLKCGLAVYEIKGANASPIDGFSSTLLASGQNGRAFVLPSVTPSYVGSLPIGAFMANQGVTASGTSNFILDQNPTSTGLNLVSAHGAPTEDATTASTATQYWNTASFGNMGQVLVRGTSVTLGSMMRATGKASSAVQSFAGSARKAVGLARSAVLTLSGFIPGLPKIQSLTASLRFSGSGRKDIGKTIDPAVTFLGSLPKSLTRGIGSVALSFSGLVQKSATEFNQLATAIMSFSGSGQKGVSELNQSQANVSFAGSSRQATVFSSMMSAAAQLSGSSARVVNHIFGSAALSFSAAIIAGHSFTQALAGAFSFLGSVSKGPGKTNAANAQFSGSTIRSTGKSLTASARSGGSSFLKSVTHTPSGIVSYVGASMRAMAKAGGIATVDPVVQFSGATASSGTSSPITMNSAPAQGDILVSFLLCSSGGEAVGTGWTLLTVTSEAILDGCWAYKVAGPSESSTQTPWTFLNCNWACGIWELKSIQTSPSNDGYAVAGGSSTTPPTITFSATPGRAGDTALVMAGINRTAAATGTIPNLSVVDGAVNLTTAFVAGHQLNVPSGSNSWTATWTGTAVSAPTAGVLFVSPTGSSGGFGSVLSFVGTVNNANAFIAVFSAATSFAGAVSRAITRKQNTGSITFSGAAAKSTMHGLAAAAFSFVGSSRKAFGSNRSAILSFIGSFGGNSHIQNLFTTLSIAGSFAKSMPKNFSALIPLAGDHSKVTVVSNLGASSNVLLNGEDSSTKDVGHVLDNANSILSGAIKTSHGIVAVLNAALSLVGSYATLSGFLQTLTASLGLAGTQRRASAKKASASAILSGSAPKLVSKQTGGSSSFSGKVSRAAGKAGAATLSLSAALPRALTRGYSAIMSVVGGMRKSPAKSAAAAMQASGSQTRKTAANRGSTVSPSGAGTSKAITHGFTPAALSLSGVFGRGFHRAFNVVVSFVGSLLRPTGQINPPVYTLPINLVTGVTMSTELTTSMSVDTELSAAFTVPLSPLT